MRNMAPRVTPASSHVAINLRKIAIVAFEIYARYDFGAAAIGRFSADLLAVLTMFTNNVH